MDLREKAEHLARLMGERLDATGEGFEARLAHAGKRLPRHIRAEGERIAEALALAEHPQLSRRIDQRRLKRACKAVERHLLGVDPWARRKAVFLDWLAGLAFALLVVGGLALWLMARRGLL